MTNRQAFRSFAHWLFEHTHSIEHTALLPLLLLLPGAIISLVDFVWHFMFDCVYVHTLSLSFSPFLSLSLYDTMPYTVHWSILVHAIATTTTAMTTTKIHITNRDSSIAFCLLYFLGNTITMWQYGNGWRRRQQQRYLLKPESIANRNTRVYCVNNFIKSLSKKIKVNIELYCVCIFGPCEWIV